MKKVTSLVIFCSFFAVLSFSQQKTFLSDIYSFLEKHISFELKPGRGHTPLIPYMSVNEALVNNKSKSSAYLSLNGSGNFITLKLRKGLFRAFLPGILMIKNGKPYLCLQTGRCRDSRPALQKCQNTFSTRSALRPKEYNPTGSYRRIFTIPSSWKGKEIFLRMEKTAFRIICVDKREWSRL